jgi:hypothetical protein
MTLDEAIEQLDEWHRNDERRDLLVLVAKGAGATITQISSHTGLTRQTVYNILATRGK